MKTEKASFMLLPAPKGTCEQCAVDHPPEQPHNQQSLFWQYWFYGKHGRFPTWADAMAHCTDAVKSLWKSELGKLGIIVPEPASIITPVAPALTNSRLTNSLPPSR